MTPTVTMSPGLFMLLIVIVMLASGSIGWLAAWQLCGEKIKELATFLRLEREDSCTLRYENGRLQKRIETLRERLKQANDGEQWKQ